MRRLIPRTVQGQFLAGTLLLQVLVLIAFLFVSIRQEVRSVSLRSQVRVETQLHLLTKLSEHAISTEDFDEMRALTEAMLASPTVLVARITDMSGKTLAVSRGGDAEISSKEREALARQVQHPGFDKITPDNLIGEDLEPVMVNGAPIAIAWIKPDDSAMLRTSKSILQNAMIYGLCVLAANVFLAAILARSIALPLKLLTKATQQVVRDPEDTSGFPLPVYSRNEAGQLTRSFNLMVQELELQRGGLHETLALMDSMLENAPIGFAFFDRKHRYVRINDFLARMSGIPAAEHIERTMFEVYGTALAEEVERIVESVFETGEDVHDLELSGTLGNDVTDEVRTWICNFYPVRTTQARVRWVGVVITDVTGRVRSEEALRKSEKLAAAGRLAASIAHEINNPLESVTNLLYLLKGNASLDMEAQEYAGLAQRELARVGEITQQTLRFYRSSTKPEMVRLGDVINSVLALHAGRIQGANVRVLRRMDAEADIFGFSGELRQLLANLVGNAVDAMPRGGTLHVRVRRMWVAGTEGVGVVIADTGTGMSDSVKQRIFEPFYTTKEATGTGLGLWVSREIVEKHHGTVSVRSSQGVKAGTVFRLFFPHTGVGGGPELVNQAIR